MTALRIAATNLNDLHRRLLATAPAEGAAFLCTERSGDNLVVQGVRIFRPDEFDELDSALSIREEVQDQALAAVKRSGHGLIDVHTHPHSDQDVTFSAFDREQLPDFARYIRNKMPDRPYGAVVLGQRGYDGLIWHTETASPLRLHAVGEVDAGPAWAAQDPSAQTVDPRYDRQVRALGTAGQARLAQLRVGVVGLGGTGSILVQQLAHLGVRDFTLIDDDRVDRTNLPRLAGASWWDAVIHTRKSRVAERQIRRMGTRAAVTRLRGLRSTPALQALRDVDLILGCVDNDGARLILSELSTAHLVPYLDIGVSIARSSHGTTIGGRVSFALPGEACLACADDIDFTEAAQDLESEALHRIRIERGYADDRSVEPALMPLNATCVSLAVVEILAFATGFRKVQSFSRYDAAHNRIVPIRVARNPDCPICVPAFGMGDRQAIDRYSL